MARKRSAWRGCRERRFAFLACALTASFAAMLGFGEELGLTTATVTDASGQPASTDLFVREAEGTNTPARYTSEEQPIHASDVPSSLPSVPAGLPPAHVQTVAPLTASSIVAESPSVRAPPSVVDHPRHSTSPAFEIYFVTDCTAHQRWMVFNTFNSARLVGQEEPMTWVRAGCEPGRSGADEDLAKAKALYANARLVDVVGDWHNNFNLAGGIPRAVVKYLEGQGSALANSTMLAMIEADFIFLSHFSLDSLDTRGLPMQSRPLVWEDGALLGPMLGVAQHYLCCDDLGPPYVLSVQAWRELAPLWSAEVLGKGWGADQVAIARAAKQARIKFNRFTHFMVSSHETTRQGWALIERALGTPAGDACATRRFGMQPEMPQLPIFMHVVQPWKTADGGPAAWGFSKYQVPPGWHMQQKTDGILECGMPSFAEPPQTLLAEISGRPKREGWVVCTIVNSLNAMLASYKKYACPEGFNGAKALKMKVPLQWTNELLAGAVEGAPEGTDLEWMRKCAVKPHC